MSSAAERGGMPPLTGVQYLERENTPRPEVGNPAPVGRPIMRAVVDRQAAPHTEVPGAERDAARHGEEPAFTGFEAVRGIAGIDHRTLQPEAGVEFSHVTAANVADRTISPEAKNAYLFNRIQKNPILTKMASFALQMGEVQTRGTEEQAAEAAKGLADILMDGLSLSPTEQEPDELRSLTIDERVLLRGLFARMGANRNWTEADYAKTIAKAQALLGETDDMTTWLYPADAEIQATPEEQAPRSKPSTVYGRPRKPQPEADEPAKVPAPRTVAPAEGKPQTVEPVVKVAPQKQSRGERVFAKIKATRFGGKLLQKRAIR